MTIVCVTGAAGFIGSNVARRLVDDGLDVVAVDDLSNGNVKFLPNGLYDFIEDDFSSDRVLRAIKTKQISYVFHLAALPRVSFSVEHPVHTNDTNVTKTLRFMNACRDNIKRFIFSSSSSVYGNTDKLPSKEEDAQMFATKSPYALQKSIIEQYLKLYASLYNFDCCSLRYFNVFGENCLAKSSPYATAISAWLDAIKDNRPLRFDGDGSQTRDMCYVGNVVQANVLAMKHPNKLSGDTFNVACGDRVSNREILDHLLKLYPKAQVDYSPWRPGDVMHTLADISKSKNVLGYGKNEPIVSFWDGFEKTIEWYMNYEETL